MKNWKKALLVASVLTLGAVGAYQPSYAASNATVSQSQVHLQGATMANGIANDTRTFAIDNNIKAVDVRFPNKFGFTVAGHLYLPANFDANKKYDAIVVSGAFGAVKEQTSGLHAQELAKRGFVAVAFDPSTNGESSGEIRDVGSPEIYTEDYSAAVDFLGSLDFVNRNRIGALGICGLSGPAITAAVNDVRIKAVATTAMYDMSDSIRNHYNGSYYTPEQREAVKAEMAKERWEAVDTGKQVRSYHEMPVDANNNVTSGNGILLPDQSVQTDPVTTRFQEYYKGRAYHERAVNSASMWDNRTKYGFFGFSLMEHIEELGDRPVLMITGDKAHSKYFTDEVYAKAGKNKQLIVVPGADHVDLYDNLNLIPMDAMADFFHKSLDNQ